MPGRIGTHVPEQVKQYLGQTHTNTFFGYNRVAA